MCDTCYTITPLFLQLEPYMDEAFLSNAMIQMGQDGVVSIKVYPTLLIT